MDPNSHQGPPGARSEDRGSPKRCGHMRTLGFSMILYPTSLLLTEYEQLVNVPYWATIEKPFSARQE